MLVALIVSALVCGAALAADLRPRPIAVGGVITALDAAKQAVTLNGLNDTTARTAPRPVVFVCNEKTVITKNGKPAEFSALAVKDNCRAAVLPVADNVLVALKVDAVTPRPPVQQVRGIIGTVDTATSTFELKVQADAAKFAVLKFRVTDATKIIKNGSPAGLADLAAGDVASVRFIPSPLTVVGPIAALSVEARTPPNIVHVKGRLVAIGDNKTIDVLPPNADAPLKFQVTEATQILKWHPAGFDALMVGDAVDVAFNAALDVAVPPAISISVMPEMYAGAVVAVNLEKGTVTLQQSPMGPARMFKVVGDTVILKNGLPAPLKALLPRDMAEVKYFRYREIDVAALIAAKSPRPGPGSR